MRQKFFNLRVKLLEHDMTQEEAAKRVPSQGGSVLQIVLTCGI